MATIKTTKTPSAKQLAARRKFTAAAKARSKTAKKKNPLIASRPGFYELEYRPNDGPQVITLQRSKDLEKLQKAQDKLPDEKRKRTYIMDSKGYVVGWSRFHKNPGRNRNSTTIIRAKRIQHLDVSKIHNGKSVRRKYRNGYLDLVIKGTAKKTPQGWEVGKKVIAQGKGIAPLSSGYYLDKSTGMVFAKRERNVAQGFFDGNGVFHPIRSSADYDGGTAGETGGKPKHTRSKKKRAATAKASATARQRATTKARKATTTRLASRALFRSTPLKRAKRNPEIPEKRATTLASIREEFTGLPARHDSTMTVSDKSPTALAKLAKLIDLRLTDGTTIKASTSGTTWICADTKKRIHFATTLQRFWDMPAGDIGKVATIAYREIKPSVGNSKAEDYEHEFGENGGTLPMLVSDGKGGAYLRGGSYTISSAGIIN